MCYSAYFSYFNNICLYSIKTSATTLRDCIPRITCSLKVTKCSLLARFGLLYDWMISYLDNDEGTPSRHSVSTNRSSCHVNIISTIIGRVIFSQRVWTPALFWLHSCWKGVWRLTYVKTASPKQNVFCVSCNVNMWGISL